MTVYSLNQITTTFTAASQLPLPRRLQSIVRAQPGYRRGVAMMLHPRIAGSQYIRLYVRVCNQWMDASLQDIYPLC